MTAEIAVHNRTAIALAADSAASIGDDHTHKVFNNAEKLFELSMSHPVGLMIYGIAELQSFPWEVIIKEFRKHLKNENRNSIETYALEFIDFAGQFYSNLPDEFQATTNTNAIFFECDEVIKNIPDYHRDSASLSNRSGIGAV